MILVNSFRCSECGRNLSWKNGSQIPNLFILAVNVIKKFCKDILGKPSRVVQHFVVYLDFHPT